MLAYNIKYNLFNQILKNNITFLKQKNIIFKNLKRNPNKFKVTMLSITLIPSKKKI